MTSTILDDNLVDLSVVMVTWNSFALTAAALDSIRNHTSDIEYEVFLIDNGTTKDDTVAEIPSGFPWVHFISNACNRGFTQANNQGIHSSKGRYVLLLNNDTLQTENALGASVKYMDEHPELGAMGIKHLNNDPERSFQPSFFSFPKPASDMIGLFRRKRMNGDVALPTASEQDVDWVCGSYLLMRRECLDQVGGLDERYFIYDEDVDWCLQAHRIGWRIRFWPGVSMVHLGAAANLHMRDKTLVMFRSHVSYLRKNHGIFAASGYYILMGLMLILAVAKQLIRCIIGRGNFIDLRQRFHRLRSFVTLSAGKVGG